MTTFPTFQHVHFADYVKARDQRPSYLHYAIDIIYTVRKDVKSMPSYFEWFYREPEEEQVRPFIGYRDRSMYAFQTARYVALMEFIVGNITPYRLMVARTGTVYVRRKPKKFYTKSFVGHVVRNWGYDLR